MATKKRRTKQTARKSTQGKRPEMQLVSLLQTLLKRDGFSDVKLEGTDGVQVAANRHVLAVRSAVFDKLLCGHFQEMDASVVKLNYSSVVLQAVVEYCYTNQAKLLKSAYHASHASAIVSLSHAADYFGLDELLEETTSHARRACLDVSVAFDYFDACKTLGPIATDEIEELALNAIRETSLLVDALDERLLPHIDSSVNGTVATVGLNTIRQTPSLVDTLARIDSPVLECILKDDKMQATELSMFLLLEAWADALGSDSSQRQEEARRLLQHIRLENIPAANLAGVVDQSDLVTKEQLLEAYKSQALCPDHRASKRPRYSPTKVWTRSQMPLLENPDGRIQFSDQLDCPPMKSGVHTWKMRVRFPPGGNANACAVGVIMLLSSSRELNSSRSIGAQPYGWEYYNNGYTFALYEQERQNTNVPYSSGSIITLTLDLRPGNGTLSASIDDSDSSIDGGDSFEIFNNMLVVEEVQSVGFVPAATVSDDATVRFLGFDHTVE